jgi:iron complex outermembrane receptor protein
MSSKSALLGCAALGALLIPAIRHVSAQTTDQPTASTGAPALEEVVVTARRRDEKAQSVPIVMDTFDQQTLHEQDIKQAQDLSHDIPGLTIQSSFRGQAQFVWLRGIPSVVTYFASVPTSLTGGGFYFDLENIQALKGPQGTLFGLNADGGAVLFEPKRPTNDFEGYGQVTLGDYSRETVEGVANIPIVADKLLLRIGGLYSHTDGFEYDRIQKKDLNDDDHWLTRLSVDLKPTDNFENYFIANYYDYHSNGSVLFPVGLNPAGLAKRFFPAIAPAFFQQQALGRYETLGTSVVGGTLSTQKQLNMSNITTWDISENLTVKNIAGYSEVTALNRIDYDGTPFPIYEPGSGTLRPSGPLATYSDELQLLGKSFDNRLSWVVGTFLSFNHTTEPQPFYTVTLGGKSGVFAGTSGRTQAVYTQGTYDLSQVVEGLSLTAGYRYSWDWRSAFQNSLNGAGATTIVYAADAQFHAPGYTVSLDYQPWEKTLFYVTYSKAYSSGGFNLTAPTQFQKYAPEYLSDVEVGVKSDWEWNGLKARTNVGGFYGWYSGIQVPQVASFTDATGLHLALETLNAATAHLQGIEAEITLLPVEGLEVTANGIVMGIKYDKYVSGGVDQSYFNFAYVPRQKYSLNARYHLPLDSGLGDISVAANFTWQAHITTTNTDLTPLQTIPSFQTLDLNLDWKNVAGRPVDLTFFMTNVTGNDVNMGGLGAYTSLGVDDRGIPEPRMFGFRLRYRFGPGLDPALF